MYRYMNEGGRTYREDSETGERDLLANFVARITREVRHIDGDQVETHVTIEGEQGEGKNETKLPAIEMPAATFEAMGWVMSKWGVRCCLQPGSSVKADMRAAIQMASDPEIVNVHRHLGWTRAEGRLTYLHAGGGITAKGNDAAIRVLVPSELTKYDLSKAPAGKIGGAASLRLVEMLPTRIGWPLLASTLAPLFGAVDFGVHLTGRTGTYKSEIMSLMQSHYGPKMDARNLPGSWSSTPNALECQAYYAKNAAFVIDDFVPSGTSWQQKQYQVSADKIMRAQGNQAGRARLTDVSTLQTTMYPRGIILSTGEDTPEGHSVRARMLILEISPGEIPAAKLTEAQARRGEYCGTVAGLAQDLARKGTDIRTAAKAYRDQYIEIGHTRTPSMVGHLIAVADAVIEWMAREGVIATGKVEEVKAMARADILAAGESQNQYLEQADPVEQWGNAIRAVLGQHIAHVRTLRGGPPVGATMLGWTEERGTGEMSQWRSHGPCIGWVDTEADEILLEFTAGYAVVKKHAGNELSLSKQTMMKRLKEAGALVRTDESRSRSTVRVTAEGAVRTVMALSLSGILQTEEKQ